MMHAGTAIVVGAAGLGWTAALLVLGLHMGGNLALGRLLVPIIVLVAVGVAIFLAATIRGLGRRGTDYDAILRRQR